MPLKSNYHPIVQPPDNSIPSTEPSEPYPASPLLGLEYVGFGRRAAARLIDLVVHLFVGLGSGIVIAILAYVVEGLTGRSAQTVLARLGSGGFQGFLLGMLGGFFYDTIMEGFDGSTMGKLIVGIMVLQETARPCTLKAAAKRSLLFFYDSLFFGLVAEHSMKQTPTQQRYGDHWAQTVVVRRRSAPPSSRHSFVRFVVVLIVAGLVDGAMLGADALLALVS
jgi:uncharacterized RDD family membrane protein YckC